MAVPAWYWGRVHVVEKHPLGEIAAEIPLSSGQKQMLFQSSMMPTGVGRSTRTNVVTMKYPIAKVSIPRIKISRLFQRIIFILFDPKI